MTTPNKNIVIEALQERFATDAVDAELIQASCENIYQWGRLQGMNEALEKMMGEFKGEEVTWLTTIGTGSPEYLSPR